MKAITDQKLKSYFLGALGVEEIEFLEEECAADVSLSERAQIVEMQLTDEYLRGDLSAAESRLFEDNYLTTEARRNKVRWAANLWKVAAEENLKAAEVQPSTPFWKTIFAGYRVPTAVGLAAAAIIFGGSVFYWLSVSDKHSEIARPMNINQSANVAVPIRNVETNRNVNSNPNEDTISPVEKAQTDNKSNAPKPNAAPEIKTAPNRIEPPAPAMVATFALVPGTLRGENEQSVVIAPNADKVNFRLKLPPDAANYQTYRAELKTAEGATIFSAPNLKSLNLTLSAKKLKSRTYMIFLEGQNASNAVESVAEYTFRVRR